MAREPLPGWTTDPWGRSQWGALGLAMQASRNGNWRAVVVGGQSDLGVTIHPRGPRLRHAQLAAEDAAREMVMAQAQALNGIVTWEVAP